MNVVAGRRVAPEFVQDALQPTASLTALEPLLDPAPTLVERRMMDERARCVRAKLGAPARPDRVAAMAM